MAQMGIEAIEEDEMQQRCIATWCAHFMVYCMGLRPVHPAPKDFLQQCGLYREFWGGPTRLMAQASCGYDVWVVMWGAWKLAKQYGAERALWEKLQDWMSGGHRGCVDDLQDTCSALRTSLRLSESAKDAQVKQIRKLERAVNDAKVGDAAATKALEKQITENRIATEELAKLTKILRERDVEIKRLKRRQASPKVKQTAIVAPEVVTRCEAVLL